MNDKIMECLTNPIQSKLLFDIQGKGQITAKQLGEMREDVPPATLYRYLKKMTAAGILKVTAENQIRGTVEKVYAVADEWNFDITKMVEENNGPMYMLLFTQFVTGLSEEFKEYTSRPDINILQDGSGFSIAPLYASREELENVMIEIGKIITPLLNNVKTPERELHNIAIIATPPKKEKKG